MKRLIVPVIFLLFIIIALLESKDLPPGAGLYPKVIIAGGFVVVTIALIKEIKTIRSEKKAGQYALKRISYEKILKDPLVIKQLFIIISTLIYIFLVEKTGFIIISTIYIFLNFYILGFRHKTHLPFISIATSLIIYLVFGLFIKIPLPMQFLEEWISKLIRGLII
ncbi:MAG: tripartite tricarboxylate transporter TctB family protein [Nitrospirota bacterium]